MSPEFVAGFFIEALKTATQINEMTLVFIPKMLAVGISILIFFPWMLQVIIDFTQNVFINIPTYIR
ncbi:MAG: flagellar biosynthetic protein FliQ [Deltaproteobacteria bacterium]|nr:flagellar biosynthetic protein FliQ [Deltaproteobacteria bacterium]